MDLLFSHKATLFFIIKLDPLNGSRESCVIFDSALQNILATYCSNTDNTNLVLSNSDIFKLRKGRGMKKEISFSVEISTN